MSLGSCNDDDPILTQKDWDGTATYFASTDEQFSTYYKPYVGYVGDPMDGRTDTVSYTHLTLPTKLEV